MSLTMRQIRQRIGTELGSIILVGTATSLGTTISINDISDDSPFDAADQAERFNGAGILVRDPAGSGTLAYRSNLTYVPASQRATFSTIAGLTGTPEYEIHREPLLHPLLVFPRLVNDALIKIRKLSFPHILLNSRGFYDLSRYPDIIGSERVRRLYYVGNNLLVNPDFNVWPTAQNGPTSWTASAALARVHIPNYPYAAQLDTSETLSQIITVGVQARRVRVVVWCKPTNTGIATLRVTARLTGGTTEREVTTSATGTATSTDFELVAEIETTSRTVDIKVQLECATAAQTVDFWGPMAYHLSLGRRQRIQPINVYNENGTMRMYMPRTTGVAQFALLLPYSTLTGAATIAADDTATTAPDELVVAAVAVEVLRWLSDNQDIPSASKAEYMKTLQTWTTKFRQRAREHMRRIAKTQQVWESGELN